MENFSLISNVKKYSLVYFKAVIYAAVIFLVLVDGSVFFCSFYFPIKLAVKLTMIIPSVLLTVIILLIPFKLHVTVNQTQQIVHFQKQPLLWFASCWFSVTYNINDIQDYKLTKCEFVTKMYYKLEIIFKPESHIPNYTLLAGQYANVCCQFNNVDEYEELFRRWTLVK